MFPPNTYVEILMSNVMIQVSGTFGRCLDHEGRSQRATLGLCHVKIQSEACSLETGCHQTMLTF